MVLKTKWILIFLLTLTIQVAIAEEYRFTNINQEILLLKNSDGLCSFRAKGADFSMNGECSLSMDKEIIFLQTPKLSFSIPTEVFMNKQFYSDDSGNLAYPVEGRTIFGVIFDDLFIIESVRKKPWDASYKILFSVEKGIICFQQMNKKFDQFWIRSDELQKEEK